MAAEVGTRRQSVERQRLVQELVELGSGPPGGEFSHSSAWVLGIGLSTVIFVPVGMELSLEAHESWVETARGRGRS